MTSYRKLLSDLVSDLEANKAVKVTEAYLAEGLSSAAIADLEKSFGVRLARNLKRFYRQVNGVTIRWELQPKQIEIQVRYRYTDKPHLLFGVSALSSLEEMLGETKRLQEVMLGQFEDPDIREDVEAFRWFDKNVDEALAGFLCEDGRIDDRVYFMLQGDGVYGMNARLEEYLAALRQSRAFIWWQKSYAFRPAGFGNADMYYYIPQLFPGERFSAFNPEDS